MRSKLYQLLNGLFLLLFVIILINCLLVSPSIFKIVGSLIILAIWGGVAYLIYRYGQNLTKKRQNVIVVFIFAIFLILQLVCMYYLSVKPSWDFSMIYKNAISLVEHNRLTDVDYFGHLPNNLFLTFVMYLIFSISHFVGVHSYLAVGILANIIMIDLSIFVLYLTAKKLYGDKMGLCTLFFCLFISPFFTYVPIFYSDTFTLLFPILISYCYIIFLESDQQFNRKNIALWGFILFLVVLGMQIKMSVAIILIAIVMDYLLRVKKDTWKKFLPSIMTWFILFYLLFHFFQGVLIQKWKIDTNQQVPFTHWIMMSLVEDGGFISEEYQYTLRFPTKAEKQKANVKVIQKRLSDYGVIGYAKFLNHKLAFTWTDGTYFAPEKLRRLPLHSDSLMYQLFSSRGKYYTIYREVAQAIHLATILLALASCILALRKPNLDEVNFARLAIFGLTIFLLIWETRSRYLVNFIPIFILTMLPIINDRMKKRVGVQK